MAIYSMSRRRLIALLALTSILLITLDVRGSAMIGRLRSVFSLVIEPFDVAARTVSRPVLTAWNGIVNYSDLERENENLRAQVDSQRGATVEARAAILEYQELRTLSQLLGSNNLPSVTVQVQGDSPGNFQNTIEINKGSIDHIAVGMPVINGGGLVGRITEVFPHSSVVLLVVDPRFSVGAKVLTPISSEIDTASTTVTPDSSASLPGTGTGTGTETATGSSVAGSTATSSSAPSSTLPGTSAPSTMPPLIVPVPTVTLLPGQTTLPLPGDPLAPVVVASPTTLPVVQPTTGTSTPGGVEVQRETGTLSGQGSGKALVLRFIDDSATTGRVAVGSTVQTAGGIRALAPAGLPIGTVSRVTQPSGSRSPLIEVQLSAGDLSRLNFLRVLLYVPNVSGG